jgi:hypothetical protein
VKASGAVVLAKEEIKIKRKSDCVVNAREQVIKEKSEETREHVPVYLLYFL